LAGKRILVVEDDGLIALDIISELRRAGCTAIGPASRLETAMTMAAAEHIDAAVLDVFLGAHMHGSWRERSKRKGCLSFSIPALVGSSTSQSNSLLFLALRSL
jgi:DNA-binding response OmpR family regulator